MLTDELSACKLPHYAGTYIDYLMLCITVSICWVLHLLLFHIAGESSAPAGTDPLAMMEFYMKKTAHEERRKQPKHSKDEMPPPASLQG